MDLYAYIHKVASNIDSLDSKQAINNVLDELERIQDMLDPALQEPVENLIAELYNRLNAID